MHLRRSRPKSDAAALKSRELPSRLSVVYEGATEGVPVHPPDLSTLGMFVNTAEYFPVGTLLKLDFCLIHSGYELNVRAEVRHSIPGVGVGVEFMDLSPEAKRGVEEEIELTDPACALYAKRRKSREARQNSPLMMPLALLSARGRISRIMDKLR